MAFSHAVALKLSTCNPHHAHLVGPRSRSSCTLAVPALNADALTGLLQPGRSYTVRVVDVRSHMLPLNPHPRVAHNPDALTLTPRLP